jgi:hypothetical protein
VVSKKGFVASYARRLLPWLVIAAAFLLNACASPQVMVGKGDLTKGYKKVYLVGPKNDPRDIMPIVTVKLKELGYEVIPVSPDDCDCVIGGSQGSGFVISPAGYIMTCSHVVGEQKEATLWLQGKRLEADVLCKDKDKDLAVLKVKGSGPLRALPFNMNYEARMGQDVYTMGFPLSTILGNSPRLTKGLVNSAVGEKDNPKELQISAEVQPGNSGGPLLDKNAAVIGVIHKTLPGSQNVNFALKAGIVRDFIATCPEKIELTNTASRPGDLDEVKNSVVQVYAGRVTEEFLKAPKMVSIVNYQSFWDVWFRFRFFNIEFYDLETRQLLLRASQYGDHPASTEQTVIDKTFEEIKLKFFPNSTKQEP